VPGQIEQSAQTTDRIAILFALLPAALYLVAGHLMFGYSLTRRRVAEIQTPRRVDAPGGETVG
jgi:Na+/melibiose symporter-like transporter